MIQPRDEHARKNLVAAFSLLGRVFLWGIRAEDLPYLASIPELAIWLQAQLTPERQALFDLPEPPTGVLDPDRDLTPEQIDEWAAEHYRVLGMNVYPYASAFLDSSRLLGGAVTEAALAYYATAGFSPETTSEAPDHLGHELQFLAHLIQTGQKRLLGEFLREHLLAWLLPLHLALQRQGSDFYGAFSGVTLSLVKDCLAWLEAPVPNPGEASPEKPETLAPFPTIASTVQPETLNPVTPRPPAPPADLLESPETRLKDIAEYILTPAYSGIYLSRENIAALGRETRVPRGFGDRVQILSNLFHAGVDYGAIGSVFALLQGVIDGWINDYAKFEEDSHQGQAARFWKKRVQVARGLTEQLLAAVV